MMSTNISGTTPSCPVEEVNIKQQQTDEEKRPGAKAKTHAGPSWRLLTPLEADRYPSSTASTSTPSQPTSTNPTSSFLNLLNPTSTSVQDPTTTTHPPLGNPHGHPKSTPVPMHSLVESSEMDAEDLTGHSNSKIVSSISTTVGFPLEVSAKNVGAFAQPSLDSDLASVKDISLFKWDTTTTPTNATTTISPLPTSSITPTTTANAQQPTVSASASTLTSTATDGSRTLCVRHQMMADQGVNGKLQKSLDALPTSERAAITGLWSTFSSSPHPKRKIILEGILTMCCFSQLSHLSESLGQIIRVDPFSLFPKEVCLRTLGYLDAISLGKAAQVSRSWRALADDDALWRRMCGQHIERKCTKCGWGLPLLERNRLKWEEEAAEERRASGSGSGGSQVEGGQQSHDHQHDHGEIGRTGTTDLPARAPGQTASPWLDHPELAIATNNLATAFSSDSSPALTPQLNLQSTTQPQLIRGAQKREAPDSLESATKRRREHQLPTLFAGPSAATIQGVTETSSDSEADFSSRSIGADSRSGVMTRSRAAIPNVALGKVEEPTRRKRKPWKHVYCERLLIERNWRKGRCNITTLKGHTNGVMCLQFHQDLAYPSHPVLITGSYDRTARVWDMETGQVLRVLEGHTRAIRALQFDQVMLVTGSMDRTLRVWNWQTGLCLRVLEGHTDGIICLHYDKEVLASGSADSTIRVWSVSNGDSFILRGHTEWVNSVLLWDGKSEPSAAPVPAGSEPVKYLFSSSDDHSIKLWDLKSKTCLRTMFGHTGQVQSLRIVIVDRESEDTPPETTTHERGSRASLNADQGQDSTSAHCSTPFQTYFNTANTGIPSGSSPSNTLQNNIHARAIAESGFQEDFDPIAHAQGRGSTTPRSLLHGHAHRHGEAAPLFEPSEDKQALLISGGLDNLIKVWDIATGTEKRTLFGHIEGVWAVDVDPLRLASASHDRTIKIWDRETGKCAQTLVGHRGAVTSLQLSDDVLVSGSDDGEIRIWSFAPPKA